MSDHQHEQTLSDRYGQAAWDTRYAESDRLWSGNPNPRLVEQVADLAPGTALDVGAGEGADAVWLAQRGWQVTALDVSGVALARAEQHAREAGVTITTAQHDLLGGGPLPGSYDLVSAQFWHPPLDRFADFRDIIGAAVRPGGTLLVVGHHPDSLAGQPDTHGHGAFLFVPEKVAALFEGDGWEVQVCDSPTRPTNRPEGPAVLTDSVVRIRRWA
ncbi:MAG: class I SAM-dependent methyltransferase [Propionibacteriales bacterium]|nr:class I SAM-dependent methyltransferase [Propionibacteriales bacterium]